MRYINRAEIEKHILSKLIADNITESVVTVNILCPFMSILHNKLCDFLSISISLLLVFNLYTKQLMCIFFIKVLFHSGELYLL